MFGLDLKPPVQLFVAMDVADADAQVGIALEMARGLVEDGKPARAKRAAVEWLSAALPRITPAGAVLHVLGPADGGPELLGIRVRPSADGAGRSRVVIITLALQDDSTAPADPAPVWLVLGLLRAAGKGTRVLGVSRAGALYVRLTPY
jgi:hypothetical protein